MNITEFDEAIKASHQNHLMLVDSSLEKLDVLTKIVNDIKSDLAEGIVKPTARTIHASAKDDTKLTVRMYFGSGGSKFSIMKSELIAMVAAGFHGLSDLKIEIPGRRSWNNTYKHGDAMLLKIVDSVFSERILEKDEVRGMCIKVGHGVDLKDWLWQKVELTAAKNMCWEALVDVSNLDLDDSSKKKIHDRKVALRRLKTALNHAYQSQSGWGETAEKSKLPSKEQVSSMVKNPPKRDRSLDQIVNPSHYSYRNDPPNPVWKGFEGKRILIFVKDYLVSLARQDRSELYIEYKPTDKDVSEVYDYLIAQSIIEM